MRPQLANSGESVVSKMLQPQHVMQVTCRTRHTSHVTRHTSHITRHTSHVTLQALEQLDLKSLSRAAAGAQGKAVKDKKKKRKVA